MDLNKIQAAIKRVIRKHSEAFATIGSNQPKLLELASITGFAEHYKAHGFFVRVHNPKGKSYFAMKAGTNGDPWNFSYFSASDGIENVELHMNVKVRSAHDLGMYCVDVGVVKANAIPESKPAEKWECLPNADLVTFGAGPIAIEFDSSQEKAVPVKSHWTWKSPCCCNSNVK